MRIEDAVSWITAAGEEACYPSLQCRLWSPRIPVHPSLATSSPGGRMVTLPFDRPLSRLVRGPAPEIERNILAESNQPPSRRLEAPAAPATVSGYELVDFRSEATSTILNASETLLYYSTSPEVRSNTVTSKTAPGSTLDRVSFALARPPLQRPTCRFQSFVQ